MTKCGVFTVTKCGVVGCKREALEGRSICYWHAYPAERDDKNNRRAAVKATRAKVSQKTSEEESN